MDSARPRNRFDPDIAAELYITNGDTLDDAYHEHGILGFTPEGSEPARRERLAASCSRTTRRTCRPSSSATCCSRSTSPSPRPTRRTRCRTWATPCGTSTSTSSPTPTAIRSPSRSTAKRSLGDVQMRYRINGGQVQTGADAGGAGRRALQQRARRLLPPPARRGARAPSRVTRSRSGSRRGGKHSVALHLHGAARVRRQGADPVGRELHGRRPTQDRTGRTT